jgi:hypothetical protein
MKKLITISTLCLTILYSYGQGSESTSVVDWSPELYQVGKKYPGYIVTMDSDTIKGFIQAGYRCAGSGAGKNNQNKCEFFANEGDKKPLAKYRPNDIKGYAIADKVYESILYSGGLMNNLNFNLVRTEGRIKVYEWYKTVENFSTLYRQSGESMKEFDNRRFETRIILKKEGEDPKSYNSYLLKFSKKMSALVGDNVELAEKISNKEKGYKIFSMLNIVEEYNIWDKEN